MDTLPSLCFSLCPLVASSLVPLPRPDGWRKAGTLPSPHRLAILNSQSYTGSYTYTYHDAQRAPPNAQPDSHLGSTEEAGSHSLFAHVSGPHDAPIIPYHDVLSSPASSDPQRHLKNKVYILLLPYEPRIVHINYKTSSLPQSGLPSRPSFVLSISISIRPLIRFISHNYSTPSILFKSIEVVDCSVPSSPPRNVLYELQWFFCYRPPQRKSPHAWIQGSDLD